MPVIHVFNKMDLVPEPEAFRAAVGARFERAVFVSAEKGELRELSSTVAALAGAKSAHSLPK